MTITPELRRVLLGFCLFAFLQLASGVVLFCVKIGVRTPHVLEFYVGSEQMRKVYPQQPDRFRPSRTMQGLIKFSLGHLCAFATLGVILGHFLRSLVPKGPRRVQASRVSGLFFLFGLLDIASSFLVRYGPTWTVHLRVAVFMAFVLTGLYLTACVVQRLYAGEAVRA